MPVDVWLMGFDGGTERAVPGLMKVFGIDEARAQALVANLPRIVKRNADRDVGDRYAAALCSIGGTVEVRDALGAGASERLQSPGAAPPDVHVSFATPAGGAPVAAPSNSTLSAPSASPVGSAPSVDDAPFAPAPSARAAAISLPDSNRQGAAPLGAPLVPDDPSSRIPPTIAADEPPPFDAGFDLAPGPTAVERPLAREVIAPPTVAAGDTSFDADLVAGVPTARTPAGEIASSAPVARPGPAPAPAPRPRAPVPTTSPGSASTGWLAFAILMAVGVGSAAHGYGRTAIVSENYGPVVEQPVVRTADLGMTIEVDECFRAPTCQPINDVFDKADFHAFVEDLYNAGATQVMFANLTKDQGALVSSWLVVEMPGDVATRSAVVSVFNDWLDTDVRDIGQPYLDTDLAGDY